MICIRHVALVGLLGAATAIGCSASEQGSSQSSAAVQGAPGQTDDPQCKKADAKDILISTLVYDSLVAGYPLTRLSVDSNGAIVGTSAPDVVAGDLEIINTVPDAQRSVARALRKVSGLPDYGIAGVDAAGDACSAVPAWTPLGTTTVATQSFAVRTNGVNDASWTVTHREFGQECPLLKRTGNKDIIDPPGDGSTNDPPSATVSATGVVANAFGMCPSTTAMSTYCKLSYATGVNWTGRWCQYYYGQLRCVLQ